MLDMVRRIPDEAAAEAWFVSQRWPDGVECAHCESSNVHDRPGRKPQRFRCRACRKYFSPKTGTVLTNSKLGYLPWVYAFYLLTTSLKGVSSMKIHRDLNVTQKTAWHLAHRIRKTWEDAEDDKLFGAVEVDETYMGGKSRNMHAGYRYKAHGNANKVIVVGAKERATGTVRTKIVPDTSAVSLGGFLDDTVEPESTLYTDQNPSYAAHVKYEADYDHFAVNHSAGEYVNAMAHTNGIESFWSMLKRGYIGTYHRMSRKHMGRYVTEFAGRHNDRPSDTLDQIELMARNTKGRQLRYKDLKAGT